MVTKTENGYRDRRVTLSQILKLAQHTNSREWIKRLLECDVQRECIKPLLADVLQGQLRKQLLIVIKTLVKDFVRAAK